jgi:hypothetical protein
MLTYALAVAKAGREIPAEALAVLRDGSPPELPFEAQRHLFWTDASGHLAFAGWQDLADEPGVGCRWHQTERRLVAFTGFTWPRGTGWRDDRSWAAQLAEHLSAHPPDQGTDRLLGVFTAIVLDRNGPSVVAPDPLGVSLIHRAEEERFSVLSSRASLAARLLTAHRTDPPPRDAIGACWLAYSPYPVGLRTGFEGVEVLPTGAWAEIAPERGMSVREPSTAPWYAPEYAHGNRGAMIDMLRADVTCSVRAALAIPDRAHLANLTGGKDSRLVLAVMLDEGVAHEFEFRTWGRPDLADVVVAKQIAERFGLRHAVNARDPRPGEPPRTEAAESAEGNRELTIRRKVGSWSGTRNVREPGIALPPRTDRVLLSGIGGEVLRTNFPGSGRLLSMDELERFAQDGLGFGSAGILKPEARDYYDREVRRSLLDGFAYGDQPQDAVDAFYVRSRLRRWFGTIQEADEAARVFPLYSTAGIRAAFAIGASDRQAEWLHFTLMRQACDALVWMPFDKGGWDPRLLSERMENDVPATGPRTGGVAGGQPRTAARDRLTRLQAVDLAIIRRYLLDDPANPVFEVVDREAALEAVSRLRELPHGAAAQVYGALTAAIWLGRRELDASAAA